jgi:hypothetical protein
MGFGNLLMGVHQFPMMKMMTNYNEKTFALFYEHLTDAQLPHIQYCENVKSIWETLCSVHEAKTIINKLFFHKRFFRIKMQKRENILVHINMVKVFAYQLHSIEVKIQDEIMYMVFFLNFLSSFDNLVASLKSMSTKDVNVQFIIIQLLHVVFQKKRR